MDAAMRGEEESLANYHNVLLGKNILMKIPRKHGLCKRSS